MICLSPAGGVARPEAGRFVMMGPAIEMRGLPKGRHETDGSATGRHPRVEPGLGVGAGRRGVTPPRLRATISAVPWTGPRRVHASGVPRRALLDPMLRGTRPVRAASAQAPRPSLPRERGGWGARTGGGARAGVLPGKPGAPRAFEDSTTRSFPRFALHVAFRRVLHPRGSRDIRRWGRSAKFLGGSGRRGARLRRAGVSPGGARPVARPYRPPSRDDGGGPGAVLGCLRRALQPSAASREGRGGVRGPLPQKGGCPRGRTRALMILPQVHLRKPCYDFSFL